MARLPGWEQRLAAWEAKARRTPFAWGTFDCALAACDGAQATTGVDYAAPFRGTYKSAPGAFKALLDFAGGDLGATADKIARDNGLAAIPVAFAQRGDIVQLETLTGPALGIVGMSGTVVLSADDPEGFAEVPIALAKDTWRAWRI